MSIFLVVGWNFPPSPSFHIKVQGKRRKSTLVGGNKATSKDVTFVVNRGDTWGRILGDNSGI